MTELSKNSEKKLSQVTEKKKHTPLHRQGSYGLNLLQIQVNYK